MRLDSQQIKTRLATLDGWDWDPDKAIIYKKFTFSDFHETMRFVNAVANIADQEDHHPDMELGYNYCDVKYTSHSLAGIGEKDFTCARRIDEITGQ